MALSFHRTSVLVALAACSFPTEIVVPEPAPLATTASSPGSDAGSDSVCAPASPAGWAPTWVPPTGAWQGQCAAQDLDNLYASCFGADATSDTCSAYETNSPTCAACALSAATDASWGPIVVYGDTTIVNQPGCLALLDPAAGACAQSAEAQTECEQALCDASCPVSDSGSLTAWQACVQEADEGACAAYGSTCLDDALGADGGGAACAGADFATAFTNVATVFCGSSS